MLNELRDCVAALVERDIAYDLLQLIAKLFTVDINSQIVQKRRKGTMSDSEALSPSLFIAVVENLKRPDIVKQLMIFTRKLS